MGEKKRSKKKGLALVLGGTAPRERRSLRKASTTLRGLPVWLSGPALTEDCLEACQQEGCNLDSLLVDYRALDTLSNFTTLVKDMESHGFKRVVLVTSKAHIERAFVIAKIILPFYGIDKLQVLTVPSDEGEAKESQLLIWRDFIRAWLWLLLGIDITFPLIRFFHPERIEQRDRRIRDYTWHGKRCYG